MYNVMPWSQEQHATLAVVCRWGLGTSEGWCYSGGIGMTRWPLALVLDQGLRHSLDRARGGSGLHGGEGLPVWLWLFITDDISHRSAWSLHSTLTSKTQTDTWTWVKLQLKWFPINCRAWQKVQHYIVNVRRLLDTSANCKKSDKCLYVFLRTLAISHT